MSSLWRFNFKTYAPRQKDKKNESLEKSVLFILTPKSWTNFSLILLDFNFLASEILGADILRRSNVITMTICDPTLIIGWNCLFKYLYRFAVLLPRFHFHCSLSSFFNSFSSNYIWLISLDGTRVCLLYLAAKFIISALHCISTKLRKLCSILALIKRNWSRFAVLLPRFHFHCSLSSFFNSFSSNYIWLISLDGTRVCLLYLAAKFIISALHCISTKLRKSCSILALIKRNWKKKGSFSCSLKVKLVSLPLPCLSWLSFLLTCLILTF